MRPVGITLLIETKDRAWVSMASDMCSQGWRTGIQDKGLLHQTLYSLHSLLHSSPTFLALLSVLPPKLSKWVKVGVESFETRPFTPFPSVNSRMTTDSVIQNWSRNTVQTSFG